jgi:hypothetical protein
MQALSKFLNDHENMIMALNLVSNGLKFLAFTLKSNDMIFKYTIEIPVVETVTNDLMKFMGGMNLSLTVLALGRMLRNYKLCKKMLEQEQDEFPIKRTYDKLVLFTFAVAYLTQFLIGMRALKSGRWRPQFRVISFSDGLLCLLNLLLIYYRK